MLKQIINEALRRASKEHGSLVGNEKQEIDKNLLALRAVNPNHVAFVQRVISRSPEFFRLSSNPNIANMTRFLLDLEDSLPLYLLSNGVIFTNPNDSENKRSSNFELDWHKDIFYTIPKSRYVHMWVPLLHDADEKIGTLQVIPGSHKLGIGKQKINIHTDYNHRYTMDPDYVKDMPSTSVDVKLGQVLLFDHRLIHRSGQNTSDKVRCTMLGLVHDVTNPDFLPVSTLYNYHKQTPEGYFAEVFNSEDARKVAHEQAAPTGEPKGGV
jgi:ectoine hydroxylase-related dioxygenase (phytanoyl-CoA dioxygenase family)